jgi:hypothetical protein
MSTAAEPVIGAYKKRRRDNFRILPALVNKDAPLDMRYEALPRRM